MTELWAELGIGHRGDIDTLVAAAHTFAHCSDALKLQYHRADEMERDHPWRANIPILDVPAFAEVLARLRNDDLSPVYVSAFSEGGIDDLLEFARMGLLDGIKLAAPEARDSILLSQLCRGCEEWHASPERPLAIISVQPEHQRRLIATLKHLEVTPDVVLHCVSQYPHPQPAPGTIWDDLVLLAQTQCGLRTGYSDHTQLDKGSSPDAWVLALRLADVIEWHAHYAADSPDAAVERTPEQFKIASELLDEAGSGADAAASSKLVNLQCVQAFVAAQDLAADTLIGPYDARVQRARCVYRSERHLLTVSGDTILTSRSYLTGEPIDRRDTWGGVRPSASLRGTEGS